MRPITGHLKADHRMGRCHLKGELGDRLHAVLCVAGYNIKWLLRMIAQKGVAFLGSLFCACAGAQDLRYSSGYGGSDASMGFKAAAHGRWRIGWSWLG